MFSDKGSGIASSLDFVKKKIYQSITETNKKSQCWISEILHNLVLNYFYFIVTPLKDRIGFRKIASLGLF